MSAGSARAQQSSVPLAPAEFRGVNYLPCATLGISNALSFLSATPTGLSGTYVSSQVRQEIGQLSKYGVNSIRVFPSFYGWLINPTDYMNNLRDFAQICASRRIVLTYVMWNTTSNVFSPNYLAVDPALNVSYDAGLHSTLLSIATNYTLSISSVPFSVVQSFDDPWQYVLHDQPGNSLFEPPYNGVMSVWPNNLKLKCEAYVDAIGNFFATDPVGQSVYGSYDLFNEPDCCGIPAGNQVEILEMTYKRLSRMHSARGAPTAEFTVGFADFNNTLANHQFLLSKRIKQTYISYHCYFADPIFAQVAQQHGQLGVSLNMPVVCSEFYDRNKPGHLGNLSSFLNSIDSNGLGGNSWVILATNLIVGTNQTPPTYHRFDGLVVPTTIPVGSFTSPLYFSNAANSAADLAAHRAWR